jgi:putative hydroxymethylpyrimidine transport system permease protein
MRAHHERTSLARRHGVLRPDASLGLASRSGIPRFPLPSPAAVAEALWVNRAYLGWHTLITLSEILSGLALGCSASRWRWA